MSGILLSFSSSAHMGWVPFRTSSPITKEFFPIWIFPSESFLIKFSPDTEMPFWFIVVGLLVGPISKIFFVESPILVVVVDPVFVLIRLWSELISLSLLEIFDVLVEILEALEAISVSLLEMFEVFVAISVSLLEILAWTVSIFTPSSISPNIFANSFEYIFPVKGMANELFAVVLDQVSFVISYFKVSE